MKIKTNIYHVSADNGFDYEDFRQWEDTIYANNDTLAYKKAKRVLSEKSGIESNLLCNISVVCRFENVTMDIPTLDPITKTIEEVNFAFDGKELRIGIDEVTSSVHYCFSPDSISLIKDYIDEVFETLNGDK